MGDISKGREHAGYQSPESRAIAGVVARLNALEGDVSLMWELLAAAGDDTPQSQDVMRLVHAMAARAKERAESTRRMFEVLNGVLPEVPK